MGTLILGSNTSASRKAFLQSIDLTRLPGKFFARESWEDPSLPVEGPSFPGFGSGNSLVNTEVFHYPGGYWANGTANLDIAELCRQGQRNYMNKPEPYSYGYNFKCAPNGDVYEIRGWDIRNAANGTPSPNANNRTISMQIVANKLNSAPGDGQAEPANSAQLAAIKWFRSENARRAGFALPYLGHRDTKPTACPGTGIYFQVTHREFEFTSEPIPEPIPEPTPQPDPTPAPFYPEDIEMILLDYGTPGVDWWWTRCLWTGTHVAWVQGKAQESKNPLTGQIQKLDNLVKNKIQIENDQHFLDILSTAKAVTAVPATFALNPGLTAAWVASQVR